MDTVWIAHPRLDDRKVEVPTSSLPHHQRAGWVETDPPPPPPLPDPDSEPPTEEETSAAPADAGASALPDPSPRGRRTTRGDE